LTRHWSSVVGSVLATRLTTSLLPSVDAGLFGWRRFALLQDSWELEDGKAEPAMRGRVLTTALSDSGTELLAHLRTCGFERNLDSAALGREFAKFACDYFPTTLLEAANENVKRSIAVLSKYPRCRCVFSSGISLVTQSAFLIVSARTLGMRVIGGQHGGHFGYIDPHVLAWETEYPDCDAFVTWGWSPMPAHPALGGVEAIPLPSPWLCARAARWKTLLAEGANLAENKEFDFAFLPNKIYAIVPAPASAHATREHLPAIARMMRDLASGCGRDGRRVLLKPYNGELGMQMPETFEKLLRAPGAPFVLSENLDKGLTMDMVRRCQMVLWDQPGTGFLECLAAGIPTMVLWPRIYHRETPRAEEMFASFERVGIVHRSTESLLGEYRRFKSSPASWFHERERAEACKRFLQAYAIVDSRWKDKWLIFIGQCR